MLEDVGFHDGAAFIRKACSMVPNALLDAGQEKLLTEHLRANFEPLKALLHGYLRGSRRPPIAGSGRLRATEGAHRT